MHQDGTVVAIRQIRLDKGMPLGNAHIKSSNCPRSSSTEQGCPDGRPPTQRQKLAVSRSRTYSGRWEEAMRSLILIQILCLSVLLAYRNPPLRSQMESSEQHVGLLADRLVGA
jgi:hypothetical protein